MRKAAEAQLGERFTLIDFHDVLLNSGPMPLDALAEEVERWVDAILKS